MLLSPSPFALIHHFNHLPPSLVRSDTSTHPFSSDCSPHPPLSLEPPRLIASPHGLIVAAHLPFTSQLNMDRLSRMLQAAQGMGGGGGGGAPQVRNIQPSFSVFNSLRLPQVQTGRLADALPGRQLPLHHLSRTLPPGLCSFLHSSLSAQHTTCMTLPAAALRIITSNHRYAAKTQTSNHRST